MPLNKKGTGTIKGYKIGPGANLRGAVVEGTWVVADKLRGRTQNPGYGAHYEGGSSSNGDVKRYFYNIGYYSDDAWTLAMTVGVVECAPEEADGFVEYLVDLYDGWLDGFRDATEEDVKNAGYSITLPDLDRYDARKGRTQNPGYGTRRGPRGYKY